MSLADAVAALDLEIADVTAARDALTSRVSALVEVRDRIAGLVDAPSPSPAAASASPAVTPAVKAAQRKRPEMGGPVDCPACGKSLASRAGLGPHRRSCPGKPADPVHVGRRAVHCCPICAESFLTPGSLSSHRFREDHYTAEERAQEGDAT